MEKNERFAEWLEIKMPLTGANNTNPPSLCELWRMKAEREGFEPLFKTQYRQGFSKTHNPQLSIFSLILK